METNYKKGDILEVKRGLYSHYGVYAGNGQVIHFTSDSGDGKSEINAFEADIKKTDLATFQKGDVITVDEQECARFSGDEIVRRAEALIGTQKGKYDLAVNNCEHFAKWCKTGEKISDQVETVAAVVPHGQEILETYSEINETSEKILEHFNKDKVDEEKTFSRIKKETQKILDDYNNKAPETTTESWTEKILKKINPLANAGDYIDEINQELTINDEYRTELETHQKKGFSIASWLAKKIGADKIFGGKELAKLSNGDQAELYLNDTQAEFYEDLKENLQNAPVATIRDFLGNLDTKDEIGKRNAKFVLTAGIKIGASKVLHFEFPTSIAAPIASAGVEIGCAVKDYANGEINALQCTGKIAKEVAVAGVHIVKRAPKALKEAALGFMKKAITPITRKIAGSSLAKASSATVSAMKNTFAVAAKSCKEKAKKIASKVGAAAIVLGKKVLGKLLG